jgi:hypothetical protein
MNRECETIILMVCSPCQEDITMAELLIEQLVLSKNDSILRCLSYFFEYGIYTRFPNSFILPEECDHMKYSIDRYFKTT